MRKFFFLLSLLTSLQSIGQDEEIRVKQRAIFIYNFARQVVWPNDSELDFFTVGVLGEDAVLPELSKMTRQGRTIRGHTLRVRRISRLSDIRRYQLVYLHKKFNYDIEEVLQYAHDQNVLVVSEGYGFNESMINIIDTPDGFEFELNETRLNIEGFVVSNGLRRSSITTAERWQELYQSSSRTLEEVRSRSAEQEQALSKQEEEISRLNRRINDQLALIDKRNVEVEALQKEINQQNEELQELQERSEAQKLAIERRELERLDQEQTFENEIEKRQEEIEQIDQTLEAQKLLLEDQGYQIDEQKSLLRIQRQELNAQEWFTILFAILAALSLITIFFIWRGYQIKRKANETLAVKNAAIEKQAREIDQKSQEMEQFAYIASHDLQEPLNTISGSLSLIDGQQLDEVGTSSVKFIDDAINRMRKMILGLMEHARLGSDVEFQELDGNQLLEGVKTNLRQRILDKRAKVEWGTMPSIYGHEVELTLLFQNLINNALKFMKPDEIPEVHISAQEYVEDARQYWLFRVQDNGIGIDPAHQQKIFGLFQRLNSRSAYEGSGIGLAHCKKIVELHGGKIWVESELGLGSTFCFTIKAS